MGKGTRELGDALTAFFGTYIGEKRRKDDKDEDRRRFDLYYNLQKDSATRAEAQFELNKRLMDLQFANAEIERGDKLRAQGAVKAYIAKHGRSPESDELEAKLKEQQWKEEDRAYEVGTERPLKERYMNAQIGAMDRRGTGTKPAKPPKTILDLVGDDRDTATALLLLDDELKGLDSQIGDVGSQLSQWPKDELGMPQNPEEYTAHVGRRNELAATRADLYGMRSKLLRRKLLGEAAEPAQPAEAAPAPKAEAPAPERPLKAWETQPVPENWQNPEPAPLPTNTGVIAAPMPGRIRSLTTPEPLPPGSLDEWLYGRRPTGRTGFELR
jgi:hypothetical protein